MPRLPWDAAQLDALDADGWQTRATKRIDSVLAPYAPPQPMVPEPQQPAIAPTPSPEPAAAPSMSFNLGDWSPWNNTPAVAQQQSAQSGNTPPSFDDPGWFPWSTGKSVAMPTSPRTVDATITTGPRPGQSLRPGESVGSVTLAGGSLEAHARAEARRLGIDPEVAVRVANTEGGFGDPTRQNMEGAPAYGPYQMYIGGPSNPGLGDEMLARGLDPRNPEHARAAVTFALEHARTNGWGAFQGARANGIGDWDGIGQQQSAAPQSRTPMPAEQTPQAQQQGAWSPGGYTPNQINAATSEGLDYETALAVCGPAAAIAFARKTGRNPTMQEAVGLAREVGWTAEAGMAGPASQQRLLQRMGVASRLTEGAPDWQSVAADVQRGNPVTISTPGHYFVAERYDPESGAFDFGESAAVLKASGGRRWFRPEELVNLGMGEARATLFIDNPESPTPSIAADPRQSLNAGAATPPAAPAPDAAAGVPPTSGGSETVMWSPDGPVEQGGMYQAATGRSGGSGVMYRGFGANMPEEVGNEQAGSSYNDPDAGGTISTPLPPQEPSYNDPTTTGTQIAPLPVNTREVPGNYPESPSGYPETTYTIADGRTEPPTPTGDWQPVETVPMPSQTPYGPPLSEAGPEPVSPYDAEQPWRPTLQIGRPPHGPNTPPAAPNAALDAPVPYGPPLSEAGPEGPRQEPTTWYGRAGQAALDYVIAPALEAMDTANEWLINSPVGNVMPQAMGRELAGSDQISREVREDQQRLEALIRRFRAGDQSVEAEIQALTANLNTRTGGGRAGLLAAGERNPDKGAETAGQVASAALTFGIAPGAGSGVVRNVVAGAMDPVGQGIGLAADAVAPVVRGARAAGRAALQAGGADAPVPSSLGSGLVPTTADLRNAAQGGVIGAASELTSDEELTPQERLARMGIGAGLGVAAGRRAGRGVVQRAAGSGMVPNGTGPQRIVMRPQGWEAASDDVYAITKPGHFYRGMTEDEFQATLGRGSGVQSRQDFSVANEGTSFSNKAEDAESYANYGRDDPRKTGRPTYLVEIAGEDGLRLDRDGYWKADGPITPDRITRLIRMAPEDGAVVGEVLPTPRAPQMAGSGFVPSEPDGFSFSDFQRAADSPEQKAARDAASQPPRRANGDQAIREQFGRPWEEVAPAIPGSADQLGDATRQMVTEGQNFKGTRNRVLPADMEQIGGPVKIEPQSMNLNSVGGSLVGAGAGANSDEDLTDQERFERAAMGMVVGGVFMRRPKGQAAAAAADPTMQRMARMMNGPQVPTAANKRGLLERWAQAMTDDRAGLRTLQEAVSAKLGRPLGAGEMVAELTRRNAASIAGQRLAEELRPAIVKVGDDDDYLAQFLIHSHNVDVAREIGQRTYDEAIKNGATPAVASARAMQAANARKFSGDLTIAETQQQLAAIQQRVAGLPDGATRWQNIQDAAQAVWDMNRKTLERKRDAGIISQDLYNELTQRYPRYVRTDIADYFDKGAGGGAATGPKRVGLSDIGVQKISAEGTTKERINPLYSTLDQTYAAEAAIARNESGQAFEELLRIDPTWQATFKEVTPAQGVNVGNPATTVPAGYTLRNGEQFLKVWKNGEARTFVVPPEYAALVSPQTGRVLGDNPAANGWRTLMNVYKSLITSKNPAFSYLVSPVRDLGDYAIQEATESAGKTQGVMGAAKVVGALPGILADYARAVPDVFAGITEGVYKGDLATMMRNGAGMMSRPQRNAKELKQAYEELRRTNGMEIRSMDDMKRAIGNVLTLGAEPVGGRLEQIPRLAAARRAARRGATPLDQTMRFRDATIDFQRAGEWSRVANELVPFFNVAVQSGAQTVRNFKKNPAAALASVAAVVGTPAILAEVWNHRDDQTARDYEDVPDYLKKTGIVFMIPGVEGRNERGDRLPNYLYIPVGQYGALVQTARENVNNVVNGKATSPDLASVSGWAALAADIGGIFSPIRGDSAASAATSLIPPGLSTAADLAADTDLYRGSKISTDQRDENASALSQASAAGFNAVTGKETRPSQWEHTYRDLGGYAATLATTGSNMLAEATGQRRPKDEDRPIQSAPIVGGLVNRVIRDTGGQRMEDARSENTRVPESIRPILEAAGVRREEVTGVSSKYQGASLTRAEQEKWQTRTNRLITQYMRAARSEPEWSDRTQREQLVKDAISRAKADAADQTLTFDPSTRIEKEERRKRRAS